MSRGPGAVEARIADLLAATRDRALTVEDLADNAYALNGSRPTREQRLSATRAAHRVLRRVEEAHARAGKLRDKAHADTKAALGREQRPTKRNARTGAYDFDQEYDKRLHADPGWIEARKLFGFYYRIGWWARVARIEGKPGHRRLVDAETWRTTTIKGRLYLHPPDVPVEVWAVRIDRSGVHWFDAEVLKVTERNVVVRYAGETARLDREGLYYWWAFWRGVMFVSSRTGRIAAELDKIWWERYGQAGAPPPSLRMPLEEARLLLGLPENYTRDDVIAAFRREVKKAHPDVGGTAEMFNKLVEARDRLLTALGTSAPPPKPPAYAPSGATIVYRSGRSSERVALGATRRLAAR